MITSAWLTATIRSPGWRARACSIHRLVRAWTSAMLSPPGGLALARSAFQDAQSGSDCNVEKEAPVQLPKSISVKASAILKRTPHASATAWPVSTARCTGLA